MKIIANIDHFEGEQTILLVDGKVKIELPREYMPAEVKAGSWVNLTIEVNVDKENETRENVKNLLDELKAGKHLK